MTAGVGDLHLVSNPFTMRLKSFDFRATQVKAAFAHFLGLAMVLLGRLAEAVSPASP